MTLVDALLTIFIAAGAMVGLIWSAIMHMKSRIRWANLYDRIDNWADKLTYGMPKELYDYKNLEDLRCVYHRSINQEIWGLDLSKPPPPCVSLPTPFDPRDDELPSSLGTDRWC